MEKGKLMLHRLYRLAMLATSQSVCMPAGGVFLDPIALIPALHKLGMVLIHKPGKVI